MKIVVLGTRGFPNVQGGVEKHCEELYPRLVKLGCEVVVLARAPYVGAKEYSYLGVTIKPLLCPKHKFLEAFVHTRRGVYEAKKLRPDIVHIHTVGPSLFVPLARSLGMKVVMTHHGPDYMRAKWNWLARAVLRKGEARGCRNAEAIICISEDIGQSVRKKFKREVTVIPNGVALPEMSQGQSPSGTVPTLQRFGVETGKYLLAVGRFVAEKGFDNLIEAFKRSAVKGWKLVMVGDADHEDAYSRKLKEMAREDSNIVLTGRLSGKPLAELYSHAGLFVLPSYYEGLPIVLLEAMSYGLSCLVSDIPANREVKLAEERYFKAGDVKELADKLAQFVDRPLSSQEYTAQRKLIAEKYNWNDIAAKTYQVYQNILS